MRLCVTFLVLIIISGCKFDHQYTNEIEVRTFETKDSLYLTICYNDWQQTNNGMEITIRNLDDLALYREKIDHLNSQLDIAERSMIIRQDLKKSEAHNPVQD